MMSYTRTVRGAAGAAGLLAAGCVLAGCHIPKVPDASSTDAAAASAVEHEASKTPEPAYPSDPEQYRVALHKLATLPIASEEDVGYDREKWPHWDEQDGCTTRQAVLRNTGAYINATGVNTGPARIDDDCDPYERGDSALKGGHNQWHSFYDDKFVTDSSDLDIDHEVPLEEMARSGGAGWSTDQREHYANDLYVLVPVTAHSNRSKGSDDPAEWQPSNKRDVCPYDLDWVNVKARYNDRYKDVPITVDQAEHDELKRTLTRCVQQAAAAQQRGGAR